MHELKTVIKVKLKARPGGYPYPVLCFLKSKFMHVSMFGPAIQLQHSAKEMIHPCEDFISSSVLSFMMVDVHAYKLYMTLNSQFPQASIIYCSPSM